MKMRKLFVSGCKIAIGLSSRDCCSSSGSSRFYRYYKRKEGIEDTIRVSGALRTTVQVVPPILRAPSQTRLVWKVKRYFSTDSVKNQLHPAKATMPDKKPFERLPKTAVPIHYDLFLKPNLKTFIFDGHQTVQIEIKEATSQIVLNSLDLTIQKCELTLSDGKKLNPQVKLVPEDELAILDFGSHLPVGPASLFMEFTGELNNKMKGFYRSNISSNDNEPNYAAVTQFEATDARRCFPCWDEPAIKAKFEVTLQVPADKVALSNMPVTNEVVNDDGTKTLQFACTPVMSTYLVAVVVGDFDYVEDKTVDGVVVRVYTPVGVRDQGLFALHVATKVLPFYNKYFRIDYPLPKIDLVAIADFFAGAMENWGLVTYRQSCLLVDSQNTSASRKQWIAVVVGHELAHQWFGNLVTMEWWTHLWLNEGYATFVENLCVAHLFPEYDIWTQFVTDMYIRSLELDCLKNSHPIEVPVGHPSEIDEIFDDISYNKGASVIRMLHQYIGDEDFRTGMNLYLTRHQYGNTFTEDLWQALQESSNKPVRDVMSSWTKQMGFPVIKITGNEQDGNKRHITLSQEVFTADTNPKNDDRLWLVPLTFSVQGHDKTYDFMLEGRSKTVTLENVKATDWVKLNPGTVGYYRTSYPEDMLSLLVPAIRDRTLLPLDRLGIVDDLFALVQAGRCPTTRVLDVISAMREEDNYTVWSSIVNCLAKLDVIVSYADCSDQFKKFGLYLLKPIGDKLGWNPKDNESHTDTLLRSLVLSRLGLYGDPETVAEARRRFADHAAGVTPIPADLRSSIYKTVLANGDQNTYDTILKLYREETLQEEKDRIYRSLGAIGDPDVLKKVLEFAMSDEVRSQDKVFVITSVTMTKIGRELAWEFLKENWTHILSIYEYGYLLLRLIKHTTENFASEERAIEIEEFFKGKHTSVAERSIQQSIESVRLNAAWLNRDRQAIIDFLARHESA